MFHGFQYCSVPTCGNNDLRSPDDTFHSLPEVDDVREAWIKKCRFQSKWERLGIKPLFRDSSSLTVCSQHFSDGDYCCPEQSPTGSSRRKLMPEAIPSVDLPPKGFLKPTPINWCTEMKGKSPSPKLKAKLQLEKLQSFGTMLHNYTMQDYRTALLQSCTFDGIKGKCHSINLLKTQGLLIPSDGDKEKLSWRTGIPSTAIQNICHYHDFMLLRFITLAPRCCDPFKKHELGQRTYRTLKNHQKRSYTVVSSSLCEKMKDIAPHVFPGAPICTSCAAEAYPKCKTGHQQETVVTSQSTIDSENGNNNLEVSEDMTANVDTSLPLLEEAPAIKGCMMIQHEFVCDCCCLVLANEVSLVDHLIWDHLNELVLPRGCKHCNKVFDIKIAHKRHALSHQKDKPKEDTCTSGRMTRENTGKPKETFLCLICSKEFNLKWDLKLHEEECRRCLQKVQRSRFKITCDFCKKVFTSEANLHEHITVYHNTHNYVYEVLFECDICHENFSRRGVLNHLKLHAASNGSGSTITSEVHGRSDLGSLLTYRSWSAKYGGHLERAHSSKQTVKLESRPDELSCEEGQMSCDICRIILSKSDLDNHLFERHAVTKWFSCKTCSQRFQSAIDCMHHHKEANHQGKISDYTCKICNKNLHSKRQLRRHKHYREKNGAKFSCSLCGKGFRSVKSLFEHHALKHSESDLLNEPAYVIEPVINMDIDTDMPFLHNLLEVNKEK